MRIEVPPRRPASLRLAPLIDVVFILLVFFMLASSFLDWRGFDVGLPPADAAPDPATDPIVVAVGADGDVRVDGTVAAGDGITERVRRLRRAAPERPVVVRPASAAPVQATVDVLDRLRAGRVDAVSLAGASP